MAHYVEGGGGHLHRDVLGLVAHDICEGLDGNIWYGDASGDEVLGDKLLECLCVELGLQLLEDFGKLCKKC